MSFAREIVWNGEYCNTCKALCHHECSTYDGLYFCSDKCLGEYLVEKFEDEIEWVDFITQEALNEREREAWDDSMRDRYL